MAEKPRHDISPGQLFCIVLSSQLGLGILDLPRVLTTRGGHTGWMFVVPLGILSILGAWISWTLCKRTNASVFGASRKILGKSLGTLLNFVILGILIAMATTSFIFFTQALMVFFFKETPFLVLAIFIYIPAFYVGLKGLRVLGRFDSFVFMAAFLLFGLAVVVYNRFRWSFLFPLTEIHYSAAPKIFVEAAFPFTGFELILFFYPWLRGNENNKVQAVLGAPTFTLLIYLFFCIVVTALFGEFYLKHQVFPLVNIVRTFKFPVIERFDIYFISIWLPAMGASATSFLMAAQIAAAEIIPKLPYKVILWGLSMIIIVSHLFFANFDFFEQASRWIGAVEMYGIGLAIPCLLLPIAMIRRVKP